VVAITDPLGRRTDLSYDATDRLIALQRPDGSSIGYTYDALGRRTGIDNPAGPDAAFSYDAAGQMIAAAYGAAWSVSYQYDGAGRLSGIIEPGRSLTMSYSYDQAGRRAGLRVNRGATTFYNLAYSYDAADQLRTIVDSAANPPATISLSYDLAGRLAQIADPSGASARYFYTAGSLSRVSHLPSQGSDIATYDYTYDAAGNVVSVSDRTPAGAFVTSYAYDALDRLTQEAYARYKIAYTYDAAGNLTRRVDPLGTLDYSYDSADQLLARGGESFGYDLNGNLTSWQSARGASTYSYDYQNHLTGLTRTDGAAMAFSYDAFGRRLTLQEPSGTRGFLYDGTDTIVIGSGDLGQMAARYLHGGGRLLARYTDQLGVSMYHGDAFDNVRYLVGSAGQPIDGYDYDAFGRAGAPGGIDSNPFRFFGQRSVFQHDTVGWPGLQMGQRYYDPQGARFITRDPLPGSLNRPNSQNRYAYGLNNPLSFGDACGLRPEKYRPSVEVSMTGATLNTADQPLPQAGDPIVPPDQRPGQPEAADDSPCGQGGALSDLGADDLGQPPGFDEADAASADWQQLTGQGGSYTLTCTANDRLLAGSFYAGLQLSAASGHAMWGSVSLAGVDEIAISGNTYYAGARYSGVLKSGDAGNSWAPAVGGLAANSVYALAIDPGASNRVYAGTEMGLFVSQNGGATWGRPAGTVPGRVVSELAFAGSALLAITDMGLFRSTNGGSTWQRPGRDLPAVQVYTLLAGQPAGTVYAGTAIGAYVSNDSGNTWSPLGTGLAGRAVHALAIDPLNGQRIMAGTTVGLFVSTDRGVTWKLDTRAGLGGASSQIGALAFCSGEGDLNLYLGTGSGVYGVASLRPRLTLPIVRAP
jgi:RHS repeat-associated protein